MLPGIKKQGITMSDVVMYLAIMAKHQRLVVLLFCVSFLAGLTYYVYARPTYYARSLIKVQTLDRPVDTEKIFKDDNNQYIMAEITAPQIYERTARRLGLDPNPKILYARSMGSVAVRLNREGNMEMQVWAYTPEIAREWNEAMLKEYLIYREEKRLERRDNIIKSFTNEMLQVSKKLDEMLNSRFEFQNTNDTIKIMVELDELRNVPRDLAIVNKRLAAIEQVRATLASGGYDTSAKLALLYSINKDGDLSVGQLVSGDNIGNLNPRVLGPSAPSLSANATPAPAVVVMPSVAADNTEKDWEKLDKRKWNLEKELSELNKVYLPRHPKVMALTRELTKVNKGLEAELEIALQRFNLEYDNLLAKRKELEQKIPDYQAVNKKGEKIKGDYALLQSGQLGWAKMYEDMGKVLSMLDFGFGKNRVYLQFMGHLELKDKMPVSPNRFKTVLYALGLAIALGLGIPFLLEFLDHTVTSVEEVENSLRIRGLGIIPKVEVGPENKHPLLLSLDDAERHLMENFRVLRTNIAFADAKNKAPQVIMVASAMPKEGKTVISSNLAVSFAQKGEKTVLVDADLRRGRMHRVFQTESAPGLSDCLVDGLPCDKAYRLIESPNLFLLPCGKHISGATELLGAPVFASLLADLRKQFDRVIIDTPPVLGLSETSMMQSHVDGVLFVISSEKTPMRTVKSAIEVLQANGANFLGFVLNRLDLSTSTNYYNYYYYSYHYYDDYGVIKKS